MIEAITVTVTVAACIGYTVLECYVVTRVYNYVKGMQR